MVGPRKRRATKTRKHSLPKAVAAWQQGHAAGMASAAYQQALSRALRARAQPTKRKAGALPKYDDPFWRNVVANFDAVKVQIAKETGLRRSDAAILREVIVRRLAEARGMNREKAEAQFDAPGGDGIKLQRMHKTLLNQISAQRRKR